MGIDVKVEKSVNTDYYLDEDFYSSICNLDSDDNDLDNYLLYLLYTKEVHYLITDDEGIHLKAESLGIEDKVIYLDIDTVVVDDIYRLWFWDIGDTYGAGCRDQVTTSVYFRDLGVDGKYINTGVMLLNLKKIREDGIIKDMFEILNNKELKFPDQDAFNIVCQHNMTYLPSMYNQAYCVTNPMGLFERAKIFHMAGPKEHWLENNVFSEAWYDAEEEFFFKYVHKEK